MASVEDGETLYVVPQQRTFVWPTIKIGRKVTVPHVKTPLGELSKPPSTVRPTNTSGSSPGRFLLGGYVQRASIAVVPLLID